MRKNEAPERTGCLLENEARGKRDCGYLSGPRTGGVSVENGRGLETCLSERTGSLGREFWSNSRAPTVGGGRQSSWRPRMLLREVAVFARCFLNLSNTTCRRLGSVFRIEK